MIVLGSKDSSAVLSMSDDLYIFRYLSECFDDCPRLPVEDALVRVGPYSYCSRTSSNHFSTSLISLDLVSTVTSFLSGCV